MVELQIIFQIRINSRLIHGQVDITWTQTPMINIGIVVDDIASLNRMMNMN